MKRFAKPAVLLALICLLAGTGLALTNAPATNQAQSGSTLSNTNTPAANPAPARPQKELSFIRKYFDMGGPFMWPLLILSIVGMGIVLERFWYFSRRKLDIDELAATVSASIDSEGIAAAIRICDEADTTGARILGEGLRLHEAGVERIEKGIETRGGIEISLLERGLSILAAVANLAPLLGFLGTVTGMIVAFQKIAGADTVSAKLVSAGIFEALITTAVGLIVAIPAFAFHNVFVHKIDKFATEVEKAGATVVNTIILKGKHRKDGEA